MSNSNSFDMAFNLKMNMGDATTKMNALIALLRAMGKEAATPEIAKGLEDAIQELEKFQNALKVVDNTLGDSGDQAKETGENFEKLVKDAQLNALQNLGDNLQGISETLINTGKDVIGTASNFEQLKARMLAATNGNKEMADSMMAWAEEFAASTPFSLEAVVEGTAKLEAYNLNAKENLGIIGDFAAKWGKPLSQAIEAVSDAQAGELERLKDFAVTKEQLIARAEELYGKSIVDNTGHITDLKAMNGALIDIMKESEGAMAAQMNTYEGAMSNFNDSMSQLKRSVGEEVLPQITDLIKGIGAYINEINQADPSTKSLAASTLLVGGSIATATAGIVTAGVKIMEFKNAMAAAGLGVTAGTAIFGGLAIVFGTVANAVINTWYELEKIKSDKIIKETQAMTKGFSSMKEAIDEVSKTPLQIALEPDLEAKLENIEARIKAIRELEISNTGEDQKFSFDVTTEDIKPPQIVGQGQFAAPLIETKEIVMELSDAFVFLTERMDKLQETFKTIDPEKEGDKYNHYKKLIAETSLALQQLNTTLDDGNPKHAEMIEKLEASRQKLEEAKDPANQYKVSLINLASVAEKAGEAFLKTNKEMADQPLDDTYVKERIQLLNDEIALGKITLQGKKQQLEEWEKSEAYTSDAIKAIRLELIKTNDDLAKAEEQTAKERAQALKEYEQSQKENFEAQFNNIKSLEELEQITASQKIKRLQQLLNSEKLTAEQIIAVKKEIHSTEEEMDKARLESAKKRKQEEENLEKERAEAIKAIRAIIYTDEDPEKNAYLEKLAKLEEEKAKFQKLAIDKNMIDQWYNTERKRLDDDYLQSVDQKNQALIDKNYKMRMDLLEMQKQTAASEEQVRQINEQQLALIRERLSLVAEEAKGLEKRLMAGELLTDQELQQLTLKKSLTEELNNFNQGLTKSAILSDSVKDSMGSTASATAAATAEANGLSDALSKAAEQAARVSTEMKKTGNVNAAENPFGSQTGLFMSMEEALSNLPGTPGYVGYESPSAPGNFGAGNQGNMPGNTSQTGYQIVGGPNDDLINTLDDYFGNLYSDRPQQQDWWNQQMTDYLTQNPEYITYENIQNLTNNYGYQPQPSTAPTVIVNEGPNYNPRVQQRAEDLIAELNQTYFT